MSCNCQSITSWQLEVLQDCAMLAKIQPIRELHSMPKQEVKALLLIILNMVNIL